MRIHTWTCAAGDADFMNPRNWDTGVPPVIDEENSLAFPIPDRSLQYGLAPPDQQLTTDQKL